MKMARIVSFKRVGRDKRSLKGIFLWKLIREGEINSYVVEEKIARRLRGSGGSGGSEMIHRTRVIFVEYSLPAEFFKTLFKKQSSFSVRHHEPYLDTLVPSLFCIFFFHRIIHS